MITIKYTVTVTHDERLYPEMEANAQVNDWWIGKNAVSTMFSKEFKVERNEGVRILRLMEEHHDKN